MLDQIEKGVLQNIESKEFNLGDKRIDKRAKKVINKMTNNLGKSIPAIFTTEAELHGAYRFFRNDLVTPEKILESHQEATRCRIKSQELVTILQDSSDFNFDYLTELEGLEQLHPGVDKGLRLHPQLAVSEEGTPLGTVHSMTYTRDGVKSEKNRNQLPIEKKESYRWLQGFREACKVAKECPNTTIVSIGDRENDIFEVLEEATDSKALENVHVLVRSNHNRSLEDPSSEMESKLEKKLTRASIVYEAEVELNSTRKKARKANVAIRTAIVTLKSPATSNKKGRASVQMNAVMVSEVDPPSDCEPLYWVLLTTLPIYTSDQIRRIVSLYNLRWRIELFFKCLKSGCQTDTLHLESVRGINNYLAMALIVAWRTMLTTYLPREYPSTSCTVLFTDTEWKLVFLAVHKGKKPLPAMPPSLKEVTMLVASLGGYIKRRNPPGMQTVWRGMIRLMDIVYGYKLAQEIRGAV